MDSDKIAQAEVNTEKSQENLYNFASNDRHFEERVVVDRKLYDQHTFDVEFGYSYDTRPDGELFRRFLQKNFTCSAVTVRNFLLGLFPIIRCISRYEFKNFFVADLVAGITVGIMHIPQGMAYSLLAGLPPVYGVYTSFFPSLLYTFFGTSGHVSVGTDAVASLLTASVRNRFVPDSLSLLSLNYNHTAYEQALEAVHLLAKVADPSDANSTSLVQFQERIHPIAVIGTLTLLVGIIQVILGACHAGFLIVYMSDQLVAGFTSGAAVIIFYSQFGKLFGIKLPNNYEGPMAAYYTFRDVFLALPEQINWVTTAISTSCIFVILAVKICINDRYRKKLRMPIPIDLIVIVIVTLISHFCKLSDTHQVRVVRYVPTGFSQPHIPDLRFIIKLIPDAIKVALINYALSMSMSQMFARRHRYRVDSNQELYAYGILNIVGSFFSAYPGAASVSRSCVQESAGSKTQLTSAVSALLILIAMFWLVPLLEPLPLCVLSAVIVVALKNLFLQLLDIGVLWKTSKADCLIFLVSFLSTVVFNATLGLAFSVVFAMFTIVVRSQRPKCLLLGRIPNTDLYRNIKKYCKVEEIHGVKIFRFDTALHYANADLFRNQLYNYIKIDFHELRDQLKQEERQRAKEESRSNLMKRSISVTSRAQSGLTDSSGFMKTLMGWMFGKQVHKVSTTTLNMTPMEMGCYGAVGKKLRERIERKTVQRPRIQTLALERNPNLPHHIIIDCLGFNYVDVTGVRMLEQVYRELNEINIDVSFANCKNLVKERFELCNFHATVPREALLLTVEDAVILALQKDQEQNKGRAASVGAHGSMKEPQSDFANSNA